VRWSGRSTVAFPKAHPADMVSSSCYQLFITLGIFVANCINYGTEAETSSRSWRLPMGIGFIWPIIMGAGMLLLPESPRWDYRKDHVERAVQTISRTYHVSPDHPAVQHELNEIREKLEAERAGGGQRGWLELFTGPRMAYRILLGITLQALQQLTGANFFFYYGTTIFTATGLKNSYVTSMILSGVNFGTTFFGLYVVEKFGRRRALITGGIWQFICFMVSGCSFRFWFRHGGGCWQGHHRRPRAERRQKPPAANPAPSPGF
jgi:MFS transporter, SP family, sugar:H+ symporter